MSPMTKKGEHIPPYGSSTTPQNIFIENTGGVCCCVK